MKSFGVRSILGGIRDMAGQKPLIGINTDYKLGRGAAPSVSYLFSGYYDSVIKAGGLPIILPPYENMEDVDRVLDMLDGMIMVGGADLDPRRDGYMLHPSVRPMAQRRETFDRELIKRVYERRIPFFGIGAGMQLLNVTMGGTLFLNISEDVNEALPHRDADDPFHRHALVVEEDSLLGRVYGDNAVLVNSLHHMAVDDVADGFLVTAKCPDSVIEAIESIRDDWFAFGTQFHPEAPSATVLDRRIFGEFITGIIRRSSRPLEARFIDEIAEPSANAVRTITKSSLKDEKPIQSLTSAKKKSVKKRASKKQIPVFAEN